MEKGTKILIGTAVTLDVLALGFVGVRSYMRRKDNDLKISIGNIDWVNKKVPYNITNNGKFQESGTLFFRSDLVGKGEMPFTESLKDKFYQTFLNNGMIIRGTSNGNQKFAKIIDFNAKTVKDFNGNVANALASAQATIKNLI